MPQPFQQGHTPTSNAQLQHALENPPTAAVEFKWLMASQGWWVDSDRFAADPRYAGELLRLATKSQSFALRECASLLQRPVGSNAA